jgi:hypothetical protein
MIINYYYDIIVNNIKIKSHVYENASGEAVTVAKFKF